MSTLHPPGGSELLALEAEARRGGSGLTAEDLIGTWWLDQLWGRQGDPQALPALLLRGIGACLAITANPQAHGGEAPELLLCNSVHLGLLQLQFKGPGWLVGRRPLLRFHFERMALVWGERELWHATLPQPAVQRMPFFALIGTVRAGDGGWLAARGRGGGLAAWQLRPSAIRD